MKHTAVPNSQDAANIARNGWGGYCGVRRLGLRAALFVCLAGFPGAAALADSDRAVSAPVLTVDSQAGSVGGEASEYVGAAYTAPLGHSFGVQLDGALGQSGDRGQGGLGGHVFWRDPNLALLGATTMWSRIGGWNVFRHGLEAEAYVGDYTVLTAAGIQRGDANKGARSTGYGNAAVSWYSRDDLKLTLGGTGFSNSRTGYSAIEWKPDDAIPWTLFGVAGAGNAGPGFALLGTRFTFGNVGTSLKDRDRHGDPENIVSFTNAGGSGGVLNSKAGDGSMPGLAPSGASAESCFVAGTPVRMADGSEKAIESIQVGEMVLGTDGAANEVVGFGRPRLGGRQLYALNGSDFFVTADHAFLTTKGWKAFDPDAINRINPTLKATRLEVGDILLKPGGTVELRSVAARDAAPETVVYNLHLVGNNTYVAQGYYVHNYGNGPTREQFTAGHFVAGTPVRMADGREKAIESIQVGERVMGTDGAVNQVIGLGRPRLDGRRLHALNGSNFFVTADHAFLTAQGWKALDPDVANRINPALKATRLQVGDVLITPAGAVELRSIAARDAAPGTELYNLHLVGNNRYVAQGYYVHNYWNGPSWREFMAAGDAPPPGAPLPGAAAKQDPAK